MKFLKVFSLVVIGHVMLVGSFLLQPGCQSIDRQWEEHRRAQQNVDVPREVLAQEQGLPVDSPDVDPSLNAGYAGSGVAKAPPVRVAPTRPSESSAPASEPLGTEPSEPLFGPGATAGINAPDEPPSPTSGQVPYTVRRGDTLWGLSKEYSVPFPALLEANGMGRESQLRVGQEIVIPSGYGEIEIEESIVEDSVPAPGTTIYTVRRGDTLSEIAVRAGTSVSRIKALNNMTGDRIRIGQKLIVPGDMVIVEETVETFDFDPADYTAVHTVARGETASGIAGRYGMAVTELLAVNGIENPRNLRAGADLKVKPAAAGSKLRSTRPASGTPPLLTPPLTTPPREAQDMVEEEAAEEEDDIPSAPEIVPDVNSLDPEPVDDEGFGAEIFEDFDTVEEVPVERRGSTEN